MKNIFDKCKFGDFELKSHIIRSGMWESQRDKVGFLTQDVFNRYEQIAKSGVGLINSELFCLDPRDRFAIYSTDMNYKGFFKDYQELTKLVHHYNVPILGQLAFFWYNDGLNQKIKPNDMSIKNIRHLQTDVIIAAKKLEFAGFDGIQINMGNNFYLSNFINPYFNQRTDYYGGNTFNRMRIVLEIIKVIKDNYKIHVNCKLNLNDGRKGGISFEESMEMCKLLEKYGADSIQLTSRTNTFSSDNGVHPFITYADKLSSELDIPVVLGGRLNDMDTINNILNTTNIEFFSMSKPFVAQPNFLEEWKANGHGKSICKGCNNCYSKKVSTCFVYGNGD
ncbi:NADH-dependent flavin oxidoreductase [Methanobrevibacter sp. 87.7]|uniref:oxidoreductase n=1 Tax=Methanobrevibacter sp. 87.7 TaxID=387957 RepID=UPI000B50079B|nr:NADH-dependent flavin oxidoreductase [Methanobrevibacter sp. 87.7]OWT33842.1 NADH-dependent flavin oxidoreductase [Methanobrevibacter sp. 87.7]